jgi:hypothetical protein
MQPKGIMVTIRIGGEELLFTLRLFSRDHESSEQFAWLNCSHREIETQLACAGAAPSIIVDSSQDETI